MSAVAKRVVTDNINLRVAPDQKALIDRAAERLGKTRTEFVLDTMRDASENVLLDQRLFKLDADAFAEFEAILDAPAEPNEGLAKTLAADTPWEA